MFAICLVVYVFSMLPGAGSLKYQIGSGPPIDCGQHWDPEDSGSTDLGCNFVVEPAKLAYSVFQIFFICGSRRKAVKCNNMDLSYVFFRVRLTATFPFYNFVFLLSRRGTPSKNSAFYLGSFGRR